MGQRILIVSASIGTGHTQAALAIQEYWQQKDPSSRASRRLFRDRYIFF